MEVLNLKRLFWGVVFPYISLTYSLHRWGFLHLGTWNVWNTLLAKGSGVKERVLLLCLPSSEKYRPSACHSFSRMVKLQGFSAVFSLEFYGQCTSLSRSLAGSAGQEVDSVGQYRIPKNYQQLGFIFDDDVCTDLISSDSWPLKLNAPFLK